MSDYISVVVFLNERELSRYSFDKTEVVVGRSSGADVVIDNVGVSRSHARIACDADGIRVTDLQSNNGTFINGERIEASPLQPGDELRVGKFTLVVEQDTGHAPVSATPEPVSSSPAAPAASADELGQDPEHTVIVAPARKQTAAMEASVPRGKETAGESQSGPLLPFLVGVGVGFLLAWLVL